MPDLRGRQLLQSVKIVSHLLHSPGEAGWSHDCEWRKTERRCSLDFRLVPKRHIIALPLGTHAGGASTEFSSISSGRMQREHA